MQFEHERVVEETERQIEHHLKGLQAVREEVGQVVSTDRSSLLVVDTTFQRAPKIIERTLHELADAGWKDLADLYARKLFGGNLPVNARDIFAQFLGSRYDVTSVDITERPDFPDDAFSGVIFSGSSADVTQALKKSSEPAYPGVRMTHTEVFERATLLYRKAQERNLPVLGFCFGHQIVSHAHGAEKRSKKF